jgi:hypothetical protein
MFDGFHRSLGISSTSLASTVYTVSYLAAKIVSDMNPLNRNLPSSLFSVAADSSRDMTASPFATAGAPQQGQPQDYNKMFKAERDNLEFSEGLYHWVGKDVEERVLRKYGKISAQ